jgi:hypothetical protein
MTLFTNLVPMIKDGKYKRENLYTAIVIHRLPGAKFNTGAKFHKIDADKPASLERFKVFCKKKFPDSRYINFYGGITGTYKMRVYI